MKLNSLGRTNIQVSELAFGTLVISPLQANIPKKEAQYLLEYAFEKGINFFDTGHLYDNYPFFSSIPTAMKTKWLFLLNHINQHLKG